MEPNRTALTEETEETEDGRLQKLRHLIAIAEPLAAVLRTVLLIAVIIVFTLYSLRDYGMDTTSVQDRRGIHDDQRVMAQQIEDLQRRVTVLQLQLTQRAVLGRAITEAMIRKGDFTKEQVKKIRDFETELGYPDDDGSLAP